MGIDRCCQEVQVTSDWNSTRLLSGILFDFTFSHGVTQQPCITWLALVLIVLSALWTSTSTVSGMDYPPPSGPAVEAASFMAAMRMRVADPDTCYTLAICSVVCSYEPRAVAEPRCSVVEPYERPIISLAALASPWEVGSMAEAEELPGPLIESPS